MEKSLNFEILKGTNLEKFYEYLKNDENVFNDSLNNKIIFIDCRKVIEYIVKEIIFIKSGIAAYEEAGSRSLKGNLYTIKEMMPKSLLKKIEYVRFAGNKYAHEVDQSFDVENCLLYTYEFIVWYLKNVEKKLDVNFNKEFVVPKEKGKNTSVKKEEYKWDETELKREIEEMKEKLLISKEERENKIKELKNELEVYKDKIASLEEKSRDNEEKMLAIQKINSSPIIKDLENAIKENRDIFFEEDIKSMIKAEEIIEKISENINFLGETFKIINDREKLYEMTNVKNIDNEYEYLKDALKNLSRENLMLQYILLEDIRSKTYGIFNKQGIFFSIWLNGKFKSVSKLKSEELEKGVLNYIKEIDKQGIESILNNLHKKLFNEENKGGVYLIDILNIYMEEVCLFLKEKFNKSGSIKKIILFTNIVQNIEGEETIVILNAMKRYYGREDVNVETLIQLDISSLFEILKSTNTLTEYVAISKLSIKLIYGLGYKESKLFNKIVKKLKERKEEVLVKELILYMASLALY